MHLWDNCYLILGKIRTLHPTMILSLALPNSISLDPLHCTVVFKAIESLSVAHFY